MGSVTDPGDAAPLQLLLEAAAATGSRAFTWHLGVCCQTGSARSWNDEPNQAPMPCSTLSGTRNQRRA